jgi:cytochrome c5
VARKKINRNEIDYLHPHGKPEMGSETIDEKDRPIEEKMRESRTSQKAIEEADGHHVCSQKCQKHHSVKATGADKTR